MGTLYECLREARLEQFYPAFRANGITRSEALINLGMPEFCALGITGSEDKRRLIELVNIIKSVHASGISNSPLSHHRGSYSHVQHEQVSQATGSGRDVLDRRQYPSSRDRDRTPHFSAASYLDMLDSSESDSSDSHSDAEAITPNFNANPASASPLRASTSKGPVERVRHTKAKGYNYGVHKVTATKTRSSRTAGSQRNITGDEKIKVCVRKRPLTRREQRAKDDNVVVVESTNTLTVNEPKLAVDLKAYTLQHEFIFDEVFDEDCSNQDVYIRAARPLISCVFNGGTTTCFAYGQTGAGKTHTMLGSEDVPGLYLLAGEDIFSIIESGRYGQDLHVWVSYFEIYCGQLFDLLNKRNRLHAREDGSRQVCIAGLTETEATDVMSLVQIMDYGNSVRSKGSTGVNPDSSRSHAILQLDIRDAEDVKLGKISFIDLAGSERASDVTDTDRQTRMEGAEINQSLLALKECIRSIDQESRHTPFRQSKLTHILKDSFIGNSRTCMIANVSPTQSACENTLNTLRYADRVKELKKDSIRTSSVGHEMNLLMNIPPTAPSIFHPSNILSSSTPSRRSVSSRINRSQAAVDFDPDPSETPIRGHNLHRRHGNRDNNGRQHQRTGPSQSQVENVAPAGNTANASPSNKASSSVPRGSSSRSSSQATAASQGAMAQPPPDASPSESDHTDTDSCNVTNPANLKTGMAQAGRQHLASVMRSTDTEFDFPTSDFNNLDEINDLSRVVPSSSENPAQQDFDYKHSVQPFLSHPVATHEAAGASENVAMSVPYYTRKAPIVKPIVYKSVDAERKDEQPQSNDSPATITSPSAQTTQKFLQANVSLPKISQLPPVFNRMPSNELTYQQNAGDIVQPSMKRAAEADRSGLLKNDGLILWNKSMMVPMPANSSDLTKFTQRLPLHNDFLPNHHQHYLNSEQCAETGMNDLSSNLTSHRIDSHAIEETPTGTVNSNTKLGSDPTDGSESRQNFMTMTDKPPDTDDATHATDASSTAINISMPGGSNANEQFHNFVGKPSTEQKYAGASIIIPSSPSSHPHPDDRLGFHMSPHPPSSPVPEALSQSPKSHSSSGVGSEPRRRRRASHSPTGDVSDDSTDSIRASFSDQGQGNYHKGPSYKSGMRKERSDPMLALDMQRKKHTLPDPQNISKMLTRSNTPKSGLSQNPSAGFKAIHNEFPSPKGLHLSPADITADSKCSGDSHTSGSEVHGEALESSPPHQQQSSIEATHTDVKMSATSTNRKDRASHLASKADGSPQSAASSSLLLPSPPTNSQSINFAHSASSSVTAVISRASGVIITEKLSSGAVFSPIHPQPVTSTALVPTSNVSSSILSSASNSTLLQPKPVTASTASWMGCSIDPSVQEVLSQATEDARIQLISAHEDQLASITSLCKHEMRLLLNAKKAPRRRGFNDYLRKVNDILQQKVQAISSLQEQIMEYQSTFITER